MAKLETAYVIGYVGRGKIGDFFIRLWTRSKVSHTEIVWRRMSYTSTPTSGTRSIPCDINQLGDDWEIIPVTIDVDRFKSRWKHIHPSNYDWRGIFLGQLLLKWGWHSAFDFYCSEVVADLIDMKAPHKQSPKSVMNYARMFVVD